MGEHKRVITRRDFIRTSSSVALVGLMGIPLLAHSSVKTPTKSRVVLIRDQNVLDRDGSPRPEILRDMLDEAVTTLLDVSDPEVAWKQLARPSDIVGIKSNVWYHLPTPKPLETVILKRLLGAGVSKENVSVDDRGVRKNPVFKQWSSYSAARRFSVSISNASGRWRS